MPISIPFQPHVLHVAALYSQSLTTNSIEVVRNLTKTETNAES